MSSIMKVFLLFAAVMVCIAEAQHNEPGQMCLCQRTRTKIESRRQIKDIQIYPKTIFCDNVEIVVTNNSGLRYCLNPNLKAVKRILANIMSRQAESTTTANLTPSSSGYYEE